MTGRHLAWVLVVSAIHLGACAPPASERQRADALPAAQEVFSAAREAMGGSGRLGEVESIRSVADCLSAGGPYTTEILSASGARTWFRQAMEGSPPFVAVVNGTEAWAVAGDGTVTELDEKSAARITGHEFQMMAVDIGTRFTAASVEAIEEFSGSTCVRVRMSDTLGNPLDAYFHLGSHLLAGLRLADPMQEGKDVWLRMIEWTKVDGVRLPSKVVATDGSGDFVLSFVEITINEVDESVFAVPEEILDD